MSKDYMKRTQVLRKNYMSHRVEMDTLDAYYVARGFKATKDQPWQIQKAVAMKTIYENKPIFIQDREFLVGGVAFKSRAGILNPDSACPVIERELDMISTREYDPFYLSEENKKLFMEEVTPYWRGKCALDRWNIMIPGDIRTVRSGDTSYVDKKFVRGYGENTPGWRALLVKGIVDIKEEAKEELIVLDGMHGEDVLKQIIFYKSLIVPAKGIVALTSRHADLAEKIAGKEADERCRTELLRIVEVNHNVPANPPRNLYEALQNMLTYEFRIFMEQNASSYNLGRMDQYLIQYYERDLVDGTTIQDEAQELTDCFWIKISEMGLFQGGGGAAFSAGYNMTVQVCTDDIDQYGDDAVSDLSYMTIQATQDITFRGPNMTVRYSVPKNLDSLLRKAAECIHTGHTTPAVYHDSVGIKMLLNRGISMLQTWDWTPCGCVETNLENRLKSYTDIGEIGMGGVVDMVTNNGGSRRAGKQIFIQTSDPRDFKTFDDFMVTVKGQIDYFVHTMATTNSHLGYLGENYRPVLALSLAYPDCMMVGEDYANGGTEFNVGNGISIIGQADIISSVADIKCLVFDEKKVSMDEPCRALDADLEGYEHVHKMYMDTPEYDSDDPKADFCMGGIYNYLVDQIEQYDLPFGKLTASMLPVSGNVPIGQSVGALPSGQEAWAPLTDGIGTTDDTNINGTTVLLKSISNLPHACFTQGTQMNLKVDSKLLEGERGLSNVMVLLKAQYTLDIYHTRYNVVNPEILMGAQKNPEDHEDLLVRVARYMAFFVGLGKNTQDDTIQRTEIENWG